MDKFRVGQKVRIVFSRNRPELVGEECIIVHQRAWISSLSGVYGSDTEWMFLVLRKME